MSENYFQCKEFKIQQDKCSMKVCTDACLFGSLLPVSVGGRKISYVLEIGTGTGILSLMYAQKNLNAAIDAVEIEKNAYEQAKENFAGSKWNDRLKIHYCDIKQYVPYIKYDLIICNPPFFENELQSGDKNKNLAKHDEGLTLRDLIKEIKKHLLSRGIFAILLPYYRIQYFEDLAAQEHFFLYKKILIKQTASHNFFRGVLFFSNAKSGIQKTEVTIKNNNGCYTPAFTALLKDYYLHL